MLISPADERGNVMLTMPILMIVVLLASAVFARSHLALDRSKNTTNDASAMAAAELAVHEAFARIDAGESLAFSGSGSIDGTDFQYSATPQSAASWDIHAQAARADIQRAFTAVIAREPQHAHSLFVVDESTIERNTGRIFGRVGTNGAMTVIGASPGSTQELYRPAGSCSGCADSITLDGPRTVAPVVAPTVPSRACPTDGTFAGVVDGRSGTPFVCGDSAVDVEFVGDVTIVNPPLVVHISEDVPLILDTARINRPGAAADFQLFIAGTRTDSVNWFDATGAQLNALLYAPGRMLTTTALDLVGSLTVDSLTVPRRGRVDITADTSVEGLGNSAWRIVDLRRTTPT